MASRLALLLSTALVVPRLAPKAVDATPSEADLQADE